MNRSDQSCTLDTAGLFHAVTVRSHVKEYSSQREKQQNCHDL